MFPASNWRPVSALLSAVLAIGLMAAAPPARAQTIRMWSFLTPEGKSPRELVLKKLIADFQAANPGVTIQTEAQNFGTITEKFFAAHQTGTAPDVVWYYTTRTHDAIKLGALANLDELFVKTMSKDDIADMDGPLWRFGATPTAHYQISRSTTVIGQIYRVDLFKQAGIDPKSLTTWDKFIAAAQKLTVKDADGKVTRWGFGQQYAGLLPQAQTLFSVLLDQDGTLFDKNLHAAWATPAGVRGLQMEADMIRTHGIMPVTVTTMSSDDLYENYNAGRYAIIRGAVARIPAAIVALGSGTVGYFPTPSFKEGQHSPTEIAGWSVAVWSGSKQRELAGKWIDFMTNRKGDALWATQAGVLPIRQSTITDNPAFFANPDNAFLSAAAADIRENGRFPPPGVSAGWNEGLAGALQDVITNRTDPKAALEKAEAAFNRANR